MIVEDGLARQRCARRPCDLQLTRSLERLPRLLGDDADEVPLDHDPDHAGQLPHGALVDAHKMGAGGRWPHHAAMQHPGHSHVVHELERSGHECGEVDPRHGRAQHGPVGRALPVGGVAERDVEGSPFDECSVAHALRRIAGHGDHAVADRQPLRWSAEAVCGQAEERLAGGGRGPGQVALVEIGRMRVAAGSRALIGCPSGVALHQPDTGHRHRQLLCDQLNLRREDPLAELALPCVGRDVAIRPDGDPGVELPRIDLRRPGGGRAGFLPQQLPNAAGAEADDQRAGAREEAAPGEARAVERIPGIGCHRGASRSRA